MNDDNALKYKAGYRRVQFSMPTEYQLQYCWKSQKQSPMIQAAHAHSSPSPTPNPPTGMVCTIKKLNSSSPAKKRSHSSPKSRKIFAKAMSGNGSPSLQQARCNNGRDYGGSGHSPVQSANEKKVHKMQQQFETRMEEAGHVKQGMTYSLT